MYTLEEAKTLLTCSNVFFGDTDRDDPRWNQTINLNDVWGWACSDCEYVEDHEMIEVATLFFHYGWNGILYWISQKRGGIKSEFHDVNRGIEFVKKEEQIKKDEPSTTKRAYTKVVYTLGE